MVRGSPAETAGIRPGDLLVALDGMPMTAIDDVQRFLSRAAIGSTVQVALLRAGRKLVPPAVLTELTE